MNKIYAILLALLVVLLFGLLHGFFVMLLWNWLVPEIFGLGTITYLQGWGLCVLCSILFKPSNTSKSE
jgi:hypothetical protein